METEKKKMAEDIIDIRAYYMRNNLIFYNIAEQEDKNPIGLVKCFVRRKLNIEFTNIEIERADRLQYCSSYPKVYCDWLTKCEGLRGFQTNNIARTVFARGESAVRVITVDLYEKDKEVIKTNWSHVLK